jgi:hypothetical protein
MTNEKKSSSKKLAIKLLILIIGFVTGWVTHGIQSLYTSNYYIVITNKAGDQYAIPLYGSGWSKNP